MALFPLIGLDNEPYSTILEYIDANRRFIYKVGTDLPLQKQGLDGNLYFSMYELQSADETYVKELLAVPYKNR